MKKSYLYYILFLISFFKMNIASGQGLTCGEIQPFCAGDSTLIFQNSTNSGVAEVGPDYGCLFSQPNPVWYFIQINQPGDLFFEIIQNSQVDFLGTPIDVDFIAWGPFSNAEFQAGVCDNLTSDMQVPGSASEEDPPNITTSQGCSYNSAAIENFNIINAQAGEIYVLLITNFDNETGFIQLQQTNAGGGSTDCSIINTTHHCEGDVISLDATTNNAVIYEWFKDGNLLPETGPILNNVAAPSAIYTANAIDSSNNSIVDYEFIIEFHAVPIAATADNLLQCDDNNDGFWAFDLSVNDVIILGIQDATQFSITYYESQANADSGSSILSIPFTNTSSLQTIYARIENNDNTNCFDTISFMIEMFDTPTANTANNLLECDDDNDGFFVFDLSVNDALILDTQDATQFSITYHDSQADANSGNNSLATSHTNTTNAQTIFARIESNVNTNCFDTTSFTIEVFDTPTANVADDLLQCDDDNDGFFAFDLDQKTTNVLGTQDTTMFTVTYHQTQAEADININNLLSPYTNLTAYQEEEIFVRIENNFNNNCFDTSSFLIDVFDTPTANSIVDFEFCDNANDGDDTNGFVTFDLSTKINEVLGAQLITDFEVKFYFTQVEADAGLAGTEITTSIQNISNPQLIVARIENVLNVDCYDTTTFNLVVNPLPVITPLVELKQCDDDTDGFTEFNLTESNELISTNFLNQTFTYHLLLADAENGLNAIPNEINYVNTDPSATPDILFIRIVNANGCFRTSQLNLIVSTTQIPQSFQLNYFVCDDLAIDDDDTNGVAAFDFSDADAQIISLFPMGQTLTVTYYITLQDALAEINAISDIGNHRNEALPFVQTIFVRVDSDVDNACLGLGAHITLTVNPLPDINLEDDYLLCVNTNGTETVNIPILDTGLSDIDYTFEWSIDNTVLVGITESSHIPVQGGIYSVLVTNNTTGCQNTDATTVNESESPMVTVELISSAFAESQVIEATAIGNGIYEFSLDDGPWQISGVFENVSSGEHVVTARDIKGCGTNSAIIIVIGYPKFFTPNGDGYHDTWNILGIANQPNAKIFIFDRYGKLIKQLSPSGTGWDGTFNGKPLLTSDYWFTVEFIEPKDGSLKLFKSHFTLKR
ncbi:gliding motility-associated C-terminal domain-containing protein [Flavobacteriaceae bacterium PRS1]|nr:gliding motility-associated C-terminal domain-containing protein [Flavobacteriaceae bacterium PRS1]